MAIKSYKKGSAAKLSANFKVCEFDCNGDRCCSTTLIDEQLVSYLQQIRDHFGKPVYICSAYRCAVHNAQVPNAAKKSKHIEGMAADIQVEGVKPAEVAKYAESIGVLGIGLYETDSDGYFVHIDTRTVKGFWYGHAQAYRATFGGYSQQSFVKDVQKACGAAVDGIAGEETLGKTVTISATFNRSHAAVKAVQTRLATLGYEEVGAADGIAGPKFTSALAHFQKDNGCTPTGLAEEWGKTWRKLLGMA